MHSQMDYTRMVQDTFRYDSRKSALLYRESRMKYGWLHIELIGKFSCIKESHINPGLLGHSSHQLKQIQKVIKETLEKIEGSISIIKTGIKPVYISVSHDFEFEEGYASPWGYLDATTLQKVDNYLTDDKLTFSICLAIKQEPKYSVCESLLYPKQPQVF
ncbi:hypothetical protein J3Q64DRAFT_1743718 [Phycomyces blakesleeanus]|uniref:HORMA domain-containing protein n=1 Tax=Phycomyces blakesleeanus TaxID=4837 RepID=A0ABR3B190_PHYBL